MFVLNKSGTIRRSIAACNNEIWSIKGSRWLSTAAQAAYQAEARPYEQIPGPPYLPGIGVLHNFLPYIGKFKNTVKEPSKLLQEIRDTYGSIVRLKKLAADRDMVIVFNMDDIAQVLRSENIQIPERMGFESLNYYRNVHKKEEMAGITGLVVGDGENWKTFRSQVNPVFLKPKIMQRYMADLEEVAIEMVQRLKSLRDDNNQIKVDFESEMNKWALESVAVVGLGRRIGCLRDDLPADSRAHQLIETVHQMFVVSMRLNYNTLWKYYATSDFKKAMAVYEKQMVLCKEYIDETMQELKNKPEHSRSEDSILEKLLKIDERVAVLMASDMLSAGVDTTAQTIIATLYLLATTPEKQDKLRQELRNNEGDTSYIKAVIKESMRMLPVAGGNSRTTTMEHVVAGYQIPKGVNMLFPHEYLSNLETQYKMADKFIPERWLVSEDDPLYYGHTHPFTTMPFGFGARSCIGRRLAEVEVETFLAKLIDSFHMEWHGGQPNRTNVALNYIHAPFHFVLHDAP